jgi:YesN/AraC family two-component response regulator
LNYLTEVRINKAKEIIASNPELKNYEISERVGLISVRYFNELFKKVVGMTPSEFRSKCR